MKVIKQNILEGSLLTRQSDQGQIQMMIKEYNQLIPLKHMHIEREKIQQVKKKRLNVAI